MSGDRKSTLLTAEQLAELSSVFKTIDADGNGFIKVNELGEALKAVGIKLAQYEVRDLLRKYDTKVKDDQLDMDEFEKLYTDLKKERDVGSKFKKNVKAKEGVEVHGGMAQSSAEGTKHTVVDEEQVAFANWINKNMLPDPDCKKYLPLDPNSKDLYTKTGDGILYCKLINVSVPNTVDERAMNKGAKLTVFQVHENLTLALNSATAIGCYIVNIGADDLRDGKPHLVLGLLWQIIRIGLLSEINLAENPNLAVLLLDGESLDDLRKLSPEQLLIRWVNYHLNRSGCGRQITNLTTDIKDSVVYTHLLYMIAPKESGVNENALGEHDLRYRAELTLQEADKIGCRHFVSPDDVVNGNYKLNLAFVANLFNNYPALDKKDDIDLESLQIHEETREEKMYRNWMNSLGVSPYVNHLYGDLSDGLIIFQLYDKIRPGIVDWSRVVKQFNKIKVLMEKIGNCNYAVELGHQVKFSLVGIQGKDIYDGNETLTLALVWQLMKAYTLSILSKLAGDESGHHPIVDKQIVTWANEKLANAGKQRQITGFNDPNISDAKIVLDLIDAIKEGAVNYDHVKQGETSEEKLSNAKFAISMGRKIGARFYALPEDIVEVKSKMVMTIFACLMIRDLQK